MNREKLDLTRPVMLSDGRKARVIATDRKSTEGAHVVFLAEALGGPDYEGIFTCNEFGEISKHASFHLTNAPTTIPVRDGTVSIGDMVWWRAHDGPELVDVGRHWVNIKDYPSLYQIEKPSVKLVYLDD